MVPDSDKVIVAYCHATEVAFGFHDSLIELTLWDITRRQRLCNGGGRLSAYSGANVSLARNELVRQFLDDTDAAWLWMVDADMVFAPDTLERLLASADPDPESEHFAPLVGGLCYSIHAGELKPTLFQLHRHPETGELFTTQFNTFPKDAMLQVSATGAACLLIHRSVLEAIRERKFSGPFPFFQETQLSDTHPVGEDVTFCFRAAQLGFPLHVHTGIHIGHQKAWIAGYAEHVAQVGDPHREAATPQEAMVNA